MGVKGTWLPSRDIGLTWIRRTRALAGDSWTAPEVPLGEASESYDLEILFGGVQASDVDPVIGALLTIGSAIWSVADKRVR